MKKLLVSVLAIAALVACNNEQTLVQQGPAPMEFGASFVENATRAEDPSTTTAKLTGFDVWGFMDNASGVVFNGEDVTKGDNGFGYTNTQYWTPGHVYYFAALAPMNSANANVLLASGDAAKYGLGTVEFTNVNGTEDLLYAATTVSTENKEVGEEVAPVKFQLNHLLSKVVFSFTNDFMNDNASIEVTNIRMEVPAQGSINLAQADWWSTNQCLYRTNKQHGLFEAALARRGIPYRVYKGMSLLEHKDVRNLIAYFSVILNPNDDESFKRIVNYPARGIGDTTIARIAEIAAQRGTSMWHAVHELVSSTVPMEQVEKVVVRKVGDFVRLINELSALRTEMGVCDFAKEVMTRSGILHALEVEKKPENDTAKDYLDQLLAMMDSYEEECNREMEEGLREENYTPSIDEWMQNMMLQNDQDTEEDGDKVTLMTVHSAKGLEYDYVYIVGMEEGLFPSSRSVESITDLEEERRLMYVAITRAKRGLMLTFSEMRRVWGKTENTSPSRFLKEIDSDYLDANFNIEELAGRNRWERALGDAEGARPRIESLKSRYGVGNGRPMGGGASRNERPRPEIINTPPPVDPARAGMRSVGVHREGGASVLGECAYKVGDRVSHPKFGAGRVERVEPLATDHKIAIVFDTYGSKTLLANFAKLTKL